MADSNTSKSAAHAKSEGAQKDLESEISALREDIAAITSTLSDLVRYKGDEVQEEARKFRTKAYSQAEKTRDRLQHDYEAYEDELQEMIRERPITAVLVAAGAGWVLSKLFRV